MRRLKDRVAVVTGAGSGIGRAVSLELAARGCDLALADINEASLRETARLVESRGRCASRHVVDVADARAMEELASQIAGHHGRIHIVVNNAGVGVGARFEEHSLEDFRWLVDINLWGVVYGCKFFLPYLRREEEAHVVNISSAAGFTGVPAMSSYCATKFAVRGFTETLRIELKRHGIGVTSVHPGAIRTNILEASRYGRGSEGAAFREVGRSVMSRIGRTPEHAARKIVDGIVGNKARVIIGADSQAIDLIVRYAPRLGEALLTWFDRRFTGPAPAASMKVPA